MNKSLAQTGFGLIPILIVIALVSGISVGVGYGFFQKSFALSYKENSPVDELSDEDFSLNSPVLSVKKSNINSFSGQTVPQIMSPSPTSASLQNGTISRSHITPTLVPSVTEVPADWKKYVVEDSDFKHTTEIFLPTNYKYHLTYGWTFEIIYEGDEILTDPKQGEVWETKLAVNRADDGSIYNRYDGSSRRSWYQKNVLDLEGGKITSVEEIAVGNGLTYLKIIVNYPNATESHLKFETHFVYVENGFLHYVKPLGARAYGSDAQIPKVIDKIFYTMKSYPSGN